jgi:type IV secretory pathway VirB4 component
VSTPPAHRATTAHLQALYPFLAEGGLGSRGVYIGRDLFGGAFVYDPWELYGSGGLTNPNMLVVGQIGRGKSSFVKAFLWRQHVFGRQAWVIDPKGEYGPLASACATTPIRVAPGAGVRLNPLEPGPQAGGRDRRQLVRRQGELLCSLAAASLGRPLLPAERTAAELALTAVCHGSDVPTLPAVVDALLAPSSESASAVYTDVAGLASDGREVALDLRRLVDGDLAGMFDGPTTAGIHLDGPLVVLDLSALYASPALGLLMTCATAWLQSTLARQDGRHRLVVVDEAWAILGNLAIAKWLQACFKLSRAFGVANVAVLHRFSDLRAVGADGSEQQRLAEGLVGDSETRVIFGQPPSEIDGATQLLGLTTTEAELLPQLPRGVALWKVGQRSFLVEHRLARPEAALVDTDRAMTGGPHRQAAGSNGR